MLPLVVLLMTVAMLALFVFFRTVRQETSSTHKLVRTLHAEAMCDMAVSRLAGLVAQKPWEDRFYLLASLQQFGAGDAPPEARYTFDHDAFPFSNEGPEYVSGDARFAGWIKDIDALERRYRVTVYATYLGSSVIASYDLRYCEGAMGPLNRTCMDLRTIKTEDLPAPVRADAMTDAVMDAIPLEVMKPENLVPGLPQGALPATFGRPGAPPPNLGAKVAGIVESEIVPSYDAPAPQPLGAPGTPAARAAADQAATAAAEEYGAAIGGRPGNLDGWTPATGRGGGRPGGGGGGRGSAGASPAEPAAAPPPPASGGSIQPTETILVKDASGKIVGTETRPAGVPPIPASNPEPVPAAAGSTSSMPAPTLGPANTPAGVPPLNNSPAQLPNP